MHTVHHTQGVILKSMSVGEANKRVWLFTKEFGLVVAMVQGVRKGGAKLQAHISDYSIIAADIIKGREVWRLISAKNMYSPLSAQTRSPFARAYVRTLTLLVRFLVDEGVHTDVYSHVCECAEFINEPVGEASVFDAVSIWKILVFLGYIAPSEKQLFIMDSSLRDVVNKINDTERSVLVSDVTQAITESHL